MKKIEAVFRPFKLDDVVEALRNLGVTGCTVIEAKGFGRQKGHTEIYQGAEYHVNFLPKLVLVVIVLDEIKDRAVQAIIDVTRTGRQGDGRIIVTTVEEFVNIRTGEDEAAEVLMS